MERRAVGSPIVLDRELHERMKAAAQERGIHLRVLTAQACEEFLDRLIPVDEFKLTRETKGN
jgi:hypothetical protein